MKFIIAFRLGMFGKLKNNNGEQLNHDLSCLLGCIKMIRSSFKNRFEIVLFFSRVTYIKIVENEIQNRKFQKVYCTTNKQEFKNYISLDCQTWIGSLINVRNKLIGINDGLGSEECKNNVIILEVQLRKKSILQQQPKIDRNPKLKCSKRCKMKGFSA